MIQPAPFVMFPDLELHFTTYLRTAFAKQSDARLSGVYFSNRVPNTRRPRMVIVSRLGGSEAEGFLDVARLQITVWAPNDAEATFLTNSVRALVSASADGNPVVKPPTLVGGPATSPPIEGQAVRFMTFDVKVRGRHFDGVLA